MTFDQAFSAFPLRMQALYESALAQVKAWAGNVPKSVVDWLKLFLPGLSKLGKQIDAMIAQLPQQPRTPEEAASIGKAWQMKNLYQGLWAPLMDAVTVTNGPGFGHPLLVPLVGFTVAGVGLVGVSVAGVAWAIAAQDYAVALQKEADVEGAEVKARVDAAKGGYELQSNTLRPKPPPAPPGDGPGWWPAVAVAAALGVGLFVYKGAS